MNLVLSPLVVSGALSLAAAGATDGGSAQRELLETLGIASHADFAALCRSVLSGEGASLRIANGVFTRPAIKPDYVSLIQSVHGARAEPLGPSYGPVNKWVEDATEGKIRDLLSDPVDPLVVAVLASAVFFKGSWAEKFDPAATAPGHFADVDGTKNSVPMMHRMGSMAASGQVAALGGAAAVRLDYGEKREGPGGGGHDYAALFVLPEQPGAAGLASAVRALSLASAGTLLQQLEKRKVRLSMPKVKASYGVASLKPALRSLGLATAFDGRGVFAAMSDDPEVHISDVVTKAVLEIDEEGTVAAAAAAVIMMTRGIKREPPPLELEFDRPFLMVVLHVPSGTPLFLSVIHEPGGTFR